MVNFASDNVTGASPEVLQALVRANEGKQSSYGADTMTAAVEARFAELFERDCRVFPVATGTACNALALSCLTPSFGSIQSAVVSARKSPLSREGRGGWRCYGSAVVYGWSLSGA